MVEIYRDQIAIDAELAMRTSKVAALQSFRNTLVAVGVTSPTMADLKAVINSEANEGFIKFLAVRGKTFTVAGLTIDPSTISLFTDYSLHRLGVSANPARSVR
jgi:hypothetical protein